MQQQFEVTINISDPVGYAAAPDRYLTNEIGNIYINHCFMGSYLLKLLKIVEKSSCTIIRSNLSAFGIVHVRFEAQILRWKIWDIIPAVKISIIAGMSIGNSIDPEMPAMVNLLPTKESSVVQHDYVVPVRVFQVHHGAMRPAPTVLGTILRCDGDAPAFLLSGTLQMSLINPILSELEETFADLNVKNPLHDFFEELVYAYTTKKADPEGTVDFVKLAKDGKVKPGIWSRPLALRRSSNKATQLKEHPQTIPLNITEGTLSILENMLVFARAIVKMGSLYTQEMIDSQEPLWAVIRRARQ